MALSPRRPDFTEERVLQKQGYRYIAGIDEAGRGALAGPVTAGAVILPPRIRSSWLRQVRDSKQLTPRKRELLFHHIHTEAVAVGIGMVDCGGVDSRGIAEATRMAMKLAVEQLSPAPEFLLIDYLRLPGLELPQKGITFGDSLCLSIACASIIAKVARDRLMVEIDKDHQGYGLARHKGYGTSLHLDCLSRLGPSPVHRLTFKPVKEVIDR